MSGGKKGGSNEESYEDECSDIDSDNDGSHDLLLAGGNLKDADSMASSQINFLDMEEDTSVLILSATSNSKKVPNYLEVEDMLIAKAYVHAMLDPFKGTGQKKTSFYNKVYDRFKLLQQSTLKENEIIPWTSKSIKQHWRRHISRGVQLFNKFYHQLKNDNKSGWNEEKYMFEASEKYAKETGEKFQFQKCVPILHGLPTFDPKLASSRKINKDVNNSEPPQGSAMERPIGSRKAKYLEKIEKNWRV